MDVSSAAGNITAQIQAVASQKVDRESKVEGNRPDNDNDADDKVATVQSPALATSGSLGRNINLVA
ncbi:MAG TPA: hypothetical protein ENK06_03525 [Gammaproteobacteria bacterium]|nr:hypothetical protein [Gammaproteobacteria bacterium]